MIKRLLNFYIPTAIVAKMVSEIIFIENNNELEKYIHKLLLDNGHFVRLVSDFTVVLDILRKNIPDLIIIDLDNFKVSSKLFYVQIRSMYPEISIIFISAKDEGLDFLDKNNLSKYDCIIKPFAAKDLLFQVEKILGEKVTLEVKLQVADLILDTETLKVNRGEKEIKLTPQEFKLLKYLMSNKGNIINRESILAMVWHYSSDIETRVVDVYMGYIRKKIDSGFDKKLLYSLRGSGYCIRE